MLSSWLPWILVALIPVAAVALRFLAEDHPRNDEPPDPGEDDRDPGPAAVPLAA